MAELEEIPALVTTTVGSDALNKVGGVNTMRHIMGIGVQLHPMASKSGGQPGSASLVQTPGCHLAHHRPTMPALVAAVSVMMGRGQKGHRFGSEIAITPRLGVELELAEMGLQPHGMATRIYPAMVPIPDGETTVQEMIGACGTAEKTEGMTEIDIDWTMMIEPAAVERGAEVEVLSGSATGRHIAGNAISIDAKLAPILVALIATKMTQWSKCYLRPMCF
jgi:hypothetical protein